jgi:hypothetical protein
MAIFIKYMRAHSICAHPLARWLSAIITFLSVPCAALLIVNAFDNFLPFAALAVIETLCGIGCMVWCVVLGLVLRSDQCRRTVVDEEKLRQVRQSEELREMQRGLDKAFSVPTALETIQEEEDLK